MITINGKTFEGDSISISNNKVTIDGNEIKVDEKEINILVEGSINNITLDHCNKFGVAGNVKTISTMSGDVDVTGDVTGNVSTMSGDVDCGNVGGKIDTMSGDVKHRR